MQNRNWQPAIRGKILLCMFACTAALLIFGTVAYGSPVPATSPAPSNAPGPLVVKAWLPIVFPLSANSSNVQRVLLHLENPTEEKVVFTRVEATFIRSDGVNLDTDQESVAAMAAHDSRELYLLFQNPGQFLNLSARVCVRYHLENQPRDAFEQTFTLTPDHRGHPEGFAP